jgi:HSP90 family molecular chaperone
MWTHPQTDVTDDKHVEFCKVLIKDNEKHLSVKYFGADGGVGFTILLFVSKRTLYDLFETKKKFKKSNFMFDLFLTWITAKSLFRKF